MNTKTYTSPRRQTMPISKLGQRRQVVIPKDICDELGLQEGDFVEVTSTKGKVIITPKKIVDADEVLTAAERAVIDTRLAEAEEDIKAGRVSGPFATVDHLKRHLNA
jgi:AbrB family looped-hinge helix DNA binding protein